MSDVKLGELEFKPEDFIETMDALDNQKKIPWHWEKTVYIAAQANRILEEKLEKAPQLYGLKGSDKKWHMDEREDYRSMPAYTHEARLVCVEDYGHPHSSDKS